MGTPLATSSAFATLPGAVVASDGPDAGSVAHYGNPFGEQRALEEGHAIVALEQRGVITIAGPDRLSWLDSFTSQRLTGLVEGDSSETLVLDPSGRIEYAARVVEDGERLWLIVDRAEVEPLLAFLQRMRFMLRVEPEDVSDAVAVIGSTAPLYTLGRPDAPQVEMPEAIAAIATAAADEPSVVARTVVWHDPWSHVAVGGHQYAESAHDYAAWSWYETIVTRGFAAGLAARAAAGVLGVAGTAAAEALRIAAWRPRLATEVDERSIPHELDWLRSAVHLDKGCYRGQETVAKVHNLGHPPRRLVQLHLDGSDAVLPRHGDVVSAPGADGEWIAVGQVTSAAQHYELGPVALAVVKRSTSPDATLSVLSDGVEVAAAQQLIVPPSAGAAVEVPRLPRLGAVTRTPRSA